MDNFQQNSTKASNNDRSQIQFIHFLDDQKIESKKIKKNTMDKRQLKRSFSCKMCSENRLKQRSLSNAVKNSINQIKPFKPINLIKKKKKSVSKKENGGLLIKITELLIQVKIGNEAIVNGNAAIVNAINDLKSQLKHEKMSQQSSMKQEKSARQARQIKQMQQRLRRDHGITFE